MGGIEIRRAGCKFSGAGIHHLKAGTAVLHGNRGHLGQAADGFILEAVLFGLKILFLGQLAVGKAGFQIGQMLHFIQ